jgi:hypothetical protein
MKMVVATPGGGSGTSFSYETCTLHPLAGGVERHFHMGRQNNREQLKEGLAAPK